MIRMLGVSCLVCEVCGHASEKLLCKRPRSEKLERNMKRTYLETCLLLANILCICVTGR